jgi:hypothetical protein
MATQGPPKLPGDDPGPTPGPTPGTTPEPQPTPGPTPAPQPGLPVVGVIMQPPDTRAPIDRGPMPLWIVLRNRRVDFDTYARFVNNAFANNRVEPDASRPDMLAHPSSSSPSAGTIGSRRNRWFGRGLHAYDLLKTATESFLLLQAAGFGDLNALAPPMTPTELAELRHALETYLGGAIGTHRLPYIQQVIEANIGFHVPSSNLPFADGVFSPRADCPYFLELIWSYWHEEGMLVQSLNALSLRFQNRRLAEGRDPLAHLELSPLRPLGAIFWGYVQDEQHRLSLARRNYEYEHEYGISLRGKAVPPTARVSDRRSKFIEAFHDLLYRCAVFYQQSANLQFNPDPFPLLNGLKEVHLVLSQGAGNQFGDLPWTARVEMLMQQWILARPEIGEFLGRRPMVVYPEAWMGNVETLKTMMRWSDTSITHFHHLARFGERVLASIRWHAWGNENDAVVARDWAHFHRPEVQGYIEAYRVATRIDLTTEPKDSQAATDRNQNPAVLLERRLEEQRRNNPAA